MFTPRVHVLYYKDIFQGVKVIFPTHDFCITTVDTSTNSSRPYAFENIIKCVIINNYIPLYGAAVYGLQ